MKRILSICVITLVAVWVAIMILGRLFYGSTISNHTEQKYFRNLNEYHPISEDQICHNGEVDTLSHDIAKVAFFFINPFYKYYIMDVGVIPRNTQLSKAIDSILNQYEEPENKFK